MIPIIWQYNDMASESITQQRIVQFCVYFGNKSHKLIRRYGPIHIHSIRCLSNTPMIVMLDFDDFQAASVNTLALRQ